MAWPKEQIGCTSERTRLPSPAFEFVLRNVGSLGREFYRAGTLDVRGSKSTLVTYTQLGHS